MLIILSLIFIFLMSLLLLTLIVDFGIFHSIFQMFLVIVNVIYILTLIKIFINRNKYKNPFKIVKEYTYIEILSNELSRLDTYQKMITLENKIILINKAGIFELVYIDEKGKLKGKLNGKWYLNDKEIPKVFNLKGKNTYNYIISNGSIVYEVDVRLIPKNKIYMIIDRHLNDTIFTERQIDSKYLELSKKYCVK